MKHIRQILLIERQVRCTKSATIMTSSSEASDSQRDQYEAVSQVKTLITFKAFGEVWRQLEEGFKHFMLPSGPAFESGT